MKKAILVVSFGTSYHETRKKTIEVCENKIKESFKDYDFYRAFTSGMIINKLKKRDNMFIAKKYRSTQYHLIEKIEDISEEGELTLSYRGGD